MALKNPQTTKGYDSKQTTRKQRTDVVAIEYDDNQVTKKNRTKVAATVEGSK
jgi:hypothetical protein